MRISAIAPVGRSTSSPIDPISWHESTKGVRAIDPNEAPHRSNFGKVMEQLEDEPHRRRMRVIEVVFAPGVSSGFVSTRNIGRFRRA